MAEFIPPNDANKRNPSFLGEVQQGNFNAELVRTQADASIRHTSIILNHDLGAGANEQWLLGYDELGDLIEVLVEARKRLA